MTSPNAWAYGRAAMTRSIARFIFDVATISIVRVILRVFSTVLIRPFSSRPFAISVGRWERGKVERRGSGHRRHSPTFPLPHLLRLLVRLDARLEVGFDLLR